MNTNYLFPHKLKRVGLVLFIPGLILGFLHLLEVEPSLLDFNVFAVATEAGLLRTKFFSFTETNILDELAGILMILGALLLAFSREEFEDEYISKIRLDSLVWATYVNYIVLILAIVLAYGISFYWVLVFNMFTLLIFFLIRFNWALHKSKVKDEE